LFEIEKDKLLNQIGMNIPASGTERVGCEAVATPPATPETDSNFGSAASTGPRFARSGNPPAAAWFDMADFSRFATS